jgi:dienelactone hydrolase
MNSILADCKQLDGSHKPRQNGKGWPIVLFSSGLFGCCEMYTQFCRELASAGAIVIAVEHEDGTGVFATNNAGEVIEYVSVPEGCDMVSFRHPFLEKRVTELETSAAMILAATRETCEGCSNPEQELLARVLRCGDPDRFLLCGHSFGCSGIVRYLRRLDEQQKSCPFHGTLLLDLWGAPLTEEDKSHCLQTPCAFLLSETFAEGGAPNAKQIIASSGHRCLGIASIEGTRHQWISESHFMFPKWLLKRIGIMGPADFTKAYMATVKASQLAMEAFLDPKLQPSFQQSLLEIDRTLIAPV